jgi:3',5'-cyclic AMP phosphodiesterase CpdA
VRAAISYRRLHWSPYMRGDGVADTGEVEFPFLRRRGAVALIGVSSAVPSLPLMATGRVGAWQIERLAPLLDACRNEGLFRVVMIHHPPRTDRRHFLRRLTDAPLLRDAFARHGAELLIHGHNHRRQTVWLDGPTQRIPAVGVPSASELRTGEHDPPGYNLYRIEGAPGAWRCEVIARSFASDRVVETAREMLTRD